MVDSPVRKPLVIGNWKMHGSLSDNAQFVQNLTRDFPQLADAALSMAICPPFPYLAQLREALPAHIAVGAQNVNAQPSGAHTGEVSLAMLEDWATRNAARVTATRMRLSPRNSPPLSTPG